MKNLSLILITALFSILLGGSPAIAQESDHTEKSATTAHESDEEHAETAGPENHGEEPGGRPHHLDEFAIFLGGTDEHGHPTEFTWGLDYKRRVADRWAVGGLFDYAGGLRNAIVAASVTWYPIGKLSLMAAPGIEFHQGRGSSEGCGCAGTLKSEEPGEADQDATYFVLRLGVGWDFHIGKAFGIQPQVNLDLVNDEKVWVYGFNFTYAW